MGYLLPILPRLLGNKENARKPTHPLLRRVLSPAKRIGMFELALIAAINTARSDDLLISRVLMDRAKIRAELLCSSNNWSHDGFRYSFLGTDFGLEGHLRGENLARGEITESAKETHKAFMHSKTHRANIKNKRFSHVGVAKGNCGIVVELFGELSPEAKKDRSGR